jgi:stage III sporulation protein AH
VKVTGFVQNSAGSLTGRSRRSWRLLLFVLVVGVLLCFAISRWHDFALTLSGKPPSVPVVTSGTAAAGEDFFIEFRLDREKTQKEQIDMVKAIIDDNQASKEVRDEAYREYLAIVDGMGKELKIEGILKAKGFDGIVFLTPDACTVVVRASSLDEKQVAQIGEAVRRITRLGLEKITVIPAPQ